MCVCLNYYRKLKCNSYVYSPTKNNKASLRVTSNVARTRSKLDREQPQKGFKALGGGEGLYRDRRKFGSWRVDGVEVVKVFAVTDVITPTPTDCLSESRNTVA